MEPVKAKNAPIGDNVRRGAVRDRSQTDNPVAETWTKRDTDNARFMDQKQDGTPFKGVRQERRKWACRATGRAAKARPCRYSVSLTSPA